MHKRYTVFIILFLLNVVVFAQQSIVPDISYSYLDKLITTAKTNYPRVKVLNERLEVAKTGVSKAGLSWFDILTFSYIYQPSNTLSVNTIPTAANTAVNRYLFNGIQLGLSLNLGTLLLKPANIKLAKTEVKIAGEERNEYLITLTSEVKKLYFTYLLQQNLVKIQTQASQDMETSIRQTKYKFQKGEVTFEVYNAALLSASTRLEQKLQAEANFFIAKSELEALVGSKLEDVK